MQSFEALFLILMAIALGRLLVGPRYPWLTYFRIFVTGALLLIAGLLVEGLRWQMLPAMLAFAIVVLASLKRSDSRFVWRMLGALPLMILVVASAVLAQLLPVVTLPVPAGPYGVGTFELSITDPARAERYAPDRKRELYLEVWYPAQQEGLANYPVRTLFQELYEGEYNRHNFFFGYLGRVATHSHVQAPVAHSTEGKFPILLFNHALDFGFTSQNQVLMEHLASYGYVVFSVAHPYQSAKVNLAEAGTVYRSSDIPADILPPRAELPEGIVSMVFEATADIARVSQLKAALLPLADEYLALEEEAQAAFLTHAVASPALALFRQHLTEDLLADFFYYDYMVGNSLTEYWVKDSQFIVDSLLQLETPLAGFSAVLDIERLGLIGMSYGGAVAGEFCKIDKRCKAGVNLDGTQFGRHWDTKQPVPFLMFGNDEHQGGNDYAYWPPITDFWDYRVKTATHMDFTDFVYLWPILKYTGFSGEIDGMRMMEILNSVQLNFFDHYLKGKALDEELLSNIPEIVARRVQ